MLVLLLVSCKDKLGKFRTVNVLESACVSKRGQRVEEQFRGKQPKRGRIRDSENVLRVPAFGPNFRDIHTKTLRERKRGATGRCVYSAQK